MADFETESQNTGLSPKQRKAVEALLLSGSVRLAASGAGVAVPTLYRWLKQPEFVAVLRDGEALAMANVSRRLVVLADSAAATLGAAMSPQEPMPTRLKAASAVLTALLRIRELATLETRIADLERRVAS